MSILRVFRKKRFCGQTVLPDRLIFNKPKIDCKCQKFSVLLGCSVCFGLLWVHKTLSRYLIDPSGLLLINFLVANLMVVALQIPFSATSSFLGKWIFGNIGCQLYAALGFVTGISSIFSLFLLVLEFYLYTEKTRLSSTYFQKSAKDRGFLHLKWIFGQWILALLLTGPPLMGTLGTVFENHRKSLIQHCERSELRLSTF